MPLRIPRQFRAACAAFAVAAYALPSVVGVVAHLGHGVEHALAWMGHRERRAVAMGVAHLHDGAPEREAGGFTHAHGGAAHTHDVRVVALLDAADDRADEAARAPVRLSSHVPAMPAAVAMASVEHTFAAAEPGHAAPLNPHPPPLPPPQA